MVIHTFSSPKSLQAFLVSLEPGKGVDTLDRLTFLSASSETEAPKPTAATFHGVEALEFFIKEAQATVAKYYAWKNAQIPSANPELRRVEVPA